MKTLKFINTAAYIGLLTLLMITAGCSGSQNKLQPGNWQGELIREDGHNILLNFAVTGDPEKPVVEFFNAEEKFKVDDISYKGDSVIIKMPFFDSFFTAEIDDEGNMSGIWTKNYGSGARTMPFAAQPGNSGVLQAYAAPNYDAEGSWETTMTSANGSTSTYIGLFKNNGTQVTGTFLTPVGDMRYLHGVVSGDTLKLTGFDGSHAMLFTGIFSDENTITDGRLYSQNRDVRTWQAGRKEYETLPAAYEPNDITPGTAKIDFRLQDMKTSEFVSLSDPKYHGKVVVISVLGSWCPNCYDEAPVLIEYYNKYKDKGLEIIGVAFEQTEDFETSKQALESFFRHFDITYPVLFSGVSFNDPELTEKVFPGLPAEIGAFPTSVFIDKSGYVRKIHGGFNGPATGKYYEETLAEFNAVISGLLAE